MALETLKKLWKNEYFQTVLTLILLIAFVLGFWYIIQTALRTEYPALAVSSSSMVPTLNVGDLIIVQGASPEQINASYLNGDIVVYKNLEEDLIVHRAVKVENKSGEYWFTTKGDNNSVEDSSWNSSRLIGKVVGRIPWIGNFPLLMHSQQNIYIFIIFIIILIVVFLFFPSETDKKEKEGEERLIIGKIPLKMIYLTILNIFLIGLIIFSLWGTFTFWNPGAGSYSRGMYVTVYGMFSDVNFHETHSKNVREVFLSQSFLTYNIDCRLSEGLRTGVPTFSWSQAAIIILLVLDAWNLIKILRKQGRLKLKRRQESI